MGKFTRILTIILLAHFAVAAGNEEGIDKNTKAFAQSAVENLPVLFRKNMGQQDERIIYSGNSAGWGANVNFLKDQISFGFNREYEVKTDSGPRPTREFLVWNMLFKNANPNVNVYAEGKAESNTNYLIGNDPSKHAINVPDYKLLNYKGIYNNIDLKYYGTGKTLKYDYVLHPGANINDIQIQCEGIISMEVNNKGELEFNTPWGILTEKMPESYQMIGDNKINVDVKYKLSTDNTFGFEVVGSYDQSLPLIIDPIAVQWATFIGGAGTGSYTYMYDLVLDAAQNIYFTGYYNNTFPVTPGSYDNTYNGGLADAYFAKMNSTGTALIYCTFIGGSAYEQAHAIDITPNNEAVIVGYTNSNNFPTSAGGYDKTYNGNDDFFIAQISANGTTLMYSTYMGTSANENLFDIKFRNGDIFAIGYGNAPATTFPTSATAFQKTSKGPAGNWDAYAIRLKPANGGASDLIYSTLLSGTASDFAMAMDIDGAGNVYITGLTSSADFPTTPGALSTAINKGGGGGSGFCDHFVAKLNPSGSGLVYSTFLGGTASEYPIYNLYFLTTPLIRTLPGAIKITATGEAVVTGMTKSADFPTTAGSYDVTYNGGGSWGDGDAFLCKLNAAGSSLIFSTFFGSAGGDEYGYDILLSPSGSIFLAGFATGPNFPTTSCAIYPTFQGGDDDHFISKFNSDASALLYSTYYGGSNKEYYVPRIAFSNACSEQLIYGGTTHSLDFPTTPGTFMPVKPTPDDIDEPFLVKLIPEIDVTFTHTPNPACTVPIQFNSNINGNCIWENTPWTPSIVIWKFGDGSTSTDLNPTHTYNGAGTYTVTLWVGYPCDSMMVQINIPKSADCLCNIVATAVSTPVSCITPQGTATVSVTAAATPITYSWSTAPSQNTVTATGLAPGTYTVNVFDGANCTGSATAVVLPIDTVKLAVSKTDIKCFGDNNGTGTATITGGKTPYVYSWTNGQANTTTTGLSPGTYSFTVTDSLGCVQTKPITITQPPALTNTTSQVSPICGATDGTASIIQNGGTPTYTYSWSTNPSQTTPNITGLGAGTYSVVITDTNGCKDTATVVLNNTNAPIVNNIVVDVKCFGDLTGTVTANVSSGTTPFTYSWNNGQIANVATGLGAGNYTVTITDAIGCITTSPAVVTQPTPIANIISPDQKICLGTSATLTTSASGGTSGYTYSWTDPTQTGASVSVSPTVITTYTVTAVDVNGCSISKTTTIDLFPAVSVIAAEPVTYCFGSGGSGTLTAQASGGNSNFTYSWLPNGQTTQSITEAPNATTTYTVIAKDGCNLTDTADVTITVIPPPTVSLVADDTSGCVPLCVNFKPESTSTLTQWSWNFGDGGNSTVSSPQHCYKTPGVFSVDITVTDNNGCTATFKHVDYIWVYPFPTADFTPNATVLSMYEPTVYLTNQSTGGTIYSWNFGDGDSSSAIHPQHTYHESENIEKFNICLTTTNEYGCTANICKPIEIRPDFDIYIPNTFTPNGDGKNDMFFAKAHGVKNFEIWIFDRWGNQIFNAACPGVPQDYLNVHWNGKVQGGGSNEVAQEDTYVWLFIVEDIFTKKHRRIGHVNIVK